MAKKKSAKKSDNFTVRGVSFPNKPNIIMLAEELAKKQNRNFSSYIVHLICMDAIKEGAKNG